MTPLVIGLVHASREDAHDHDREREDRHRREAQRAGVVDVRDGLGRLAEQDRCEHPQQVGRGHDDADERERRRAAATLTMMPT